MSKQKVNEFILKINKEAQTTIVLTTHDIQDIEKLCNRMILIDQGKLEYDGKVRDFIMRYKDYKRIKFNFRDNKIIVPSLKHIRLIEENYDSKEYLFHTNDYSEQEVVGIFSKIEGMYNFVIQDIDLTLIMKLLTQENK
ncbi:hypothetical protein FY526_24630 [Clostridioides difficile]|nr:hypothetical protein FY526_24630 [Clostridioides difficile]